jgi:prepilin-type N-terminal cleavage/methylation domain-containing protein
MRNKLARPRQTSGFTLVELLVVISILASLIGIMMPALNGVRESMWATRSLARVSELATGVEAYRREYNYYPGQKDWATTATWSNGSLKLAEALFDPDGNGTFEAKFAPLNEGDLLTINGGGIWDRFHEDYPAAVCYYPARPGENTLAQFIANHNSAHTDSISDFNDYIRDTRFAGSGSTTPYNAGKFLLIAPGKDRVYCTADDNRNFGN